MKKLVYSSMLLLVLSFTANTALADEKKPKIELTESQKLELNKMTNRVEEIRAMDKSTLSKDERKALRKELKEMKQRAREMGGGIYLSVGAIIIIILVLIIIL